MKTPHSTLFRYSPETIATANKIPVGTVSERGHKLGMENGEPLIVMLDCLMKYADAYRQRFEGPLSGDYVLGPLWLKAAENVRALLNGDGAIAMQKGITTDSKDNGAAEAMFWDALDRAGFEEKDMS